MTIFPIFDKIRIQNAGAPAKERIKQFDGKTAYGDFAYRFISRQFKWLLFCPVFFSEGFTMETVKRQKGRELAMNLHFEPVTPANRSR